jgi:predicted PurR-regulated permease PerM
VPGWIQDTEDLAARFGITVRLTELAGRATTQLQAGGSALLGGTAGVVAGITSTLADVGLTLVLSFYFAVDGPRMRDQAMARLPLSAKPNALRLETSVRRVFGSYLRGQLILGLMLGVVAGVGAAAFGLPYPVVIGVLAGLFELVPMFGSLLGAIPAVIVALFQPFPTVLWVILFFFIVNQAENYLLAPRITGESLGLTPFTTLLALLLGIEIAGFLGALVAVPVAAVLLDLTRPMEPGGQEAIEEMEQGTPRGV